MSKNKDGGGSREQKGNRDSGRKSEHGGVRNNESTVSFDKPIPPEKPKDK